MLDVDDVAFVGDVALLDADEDGNRSGDGFDVVALLDGDGFRPAGVFFGAELRPFGAGCFPPRAGEEVEVERGESEAPVPPAPEPESSRRAERARESRERLEKDMTPRYYVLQFQCGRANVGDC